MKTVVQLDVNGYFVGTTTADESPKEPGVYLMPAGTVDTEAPTVPDGQRAKWDNGWVFEDVPVPVSDIPTEPDFDSLPWDVKRAMSYPPPDDYLDGIVKGDQAQIDKYIADCLAVKAEYPKP